MEMLRWITLLTFISVVLLKQVNRDVLQSIEEVIGTERYVNTIHARHKLIDWFVRQRTNGSSTGKWGHELPRIATALFLGDETIFERGNSLGDEIRYELLIELFPKVSKLNDTKSEELALYINALTVACVEPTNFFGHNLVAKLRSKVAHSKYKNPFTLLAMCNGGEIMDSIDRFLMQRAFEDERRAFWADTQSIAIMALRCMAFDEEELDRNRERWLAENQFKNGTVDNPVSTALLVQALINDLTAVASDFNLSAALDVILKGQREDGSWGGSIRDSYFVLPVLNFKSLVNIDFEHCKKRNTNEEPNRKVQEANHEKEVNNEFVVHYTVLFDENFEQARTWRVMVTKYTTFYDVIETVNKLDKKHNVKYRIINGRPDVSSLYEKKEDPEYGLYWFTYIRPSLLTKETPVLSPIDVRVKPNEELIMWYRQAEWIGNSPETAF